jgi:hypothetical protein
MSVPTQPNSADKQTAQWNYVDVQVLDGQRVLRPTHVSFDQLIFAEPPNLSSQHIEIVITNNGRSHPSRATVLPHDPQSTRIPIQLIQTEQKAAAKLTA